MKAALPKRGTDFNACTSCSGQKHGHRIYLQKLATCHTYESSMKNALTVEKIAAWRSHPARVPLHCRLCNDGAQTHTHSQIKFAHRDFYSARMKFGVWKAHHRAILPARKGCLSSPLPHHSRAGFRLIYYVVVVVLLRGRLAGYLPLGCEEPSTTNCFYYIHDKPSSSLLYLISQNNIIKITQLVENYLVNHICESPPTPSIAKPQLSI